METVQYKIQFSGRQLAAAFFSLALFVTGAMPIFAQSHISTQPHQATVNMIVPVTSAQASSRLGNRSSQSSNQQVNFFSGSSDGFLIKWNGDSKGEHYQVTNLEIRLIAYSPKGNEVAIYETDGGRINRISVWDWKNFTKKYSRRFSNSITTLTYSAKGTYLIAGTTTVDGAVVMQASNGNVVNLIKDPTGIVSYILTSDTEKTALMYSPSGNISYYSLQTGKLTQRFTCEQGLAQPVLFNNGLYLAGVRNNFVYISYALTGQTLASYECTNPILLTADDDTDLYYIDGNGRGNYTVNVIRNRNNRGVTSPEILKNISGPRGNQAICTGTKIENTLTLGTLSGEIYKINLNDEQGMSLITQNLYENVFDVAAVENGFYLLTTTGIFHADEKGASIRKIASNRGHTRLIPMGENVILWSHDTRDPVLSLNLPTGQTSTLFTPQASLQTVKFFDNKLISLENYSDVNLYDFDTQVLSPIYTGTALQDVIPMENGNIYVSKSSATLPNTPLVAVNIKTGETVPVAVNANVVFSLSAKDSVIYGVSYSSSGNSMTTSVFSYNTATRRTESFVRLDDEDTNAITFIGDSNLYTNIGNDKLYSYDLRSHKNIQFNRSASIPQKVSENSNRIVVLNYDGSISWYNKASSKIEATLYLRRDGQWSTL